MSRTGAHNCRNRGRSLPFPRETPSKAPFTRPRRGPEVTAWFEPLLGTRSSAGSVVLAAAEDSGRLCLEGPDWVTKYRGDFVLDGAWLKEVCGHFKERSSGADHQEHPEVPRDETRWDRGDIENIADGRQPPRPHVHVSIHELRPKLVVCPRDGHGATVTSSSNGGAPRQRDTSAFGVHRGTVAKLVADNDARRPRSPAPEEIAESIEAPSPGLSCHHIAEQLGRHDGTIWLALKKANVTSDWKFESCPIRPTHSLHGVRSPPCS